MEKFEKIIGQKPLYGSPPVMQASDYYKISKEAIGTGNSQAKRKQRLMSMSPQVTREFPLEVERQQRDHQHQFHNISQDAIQELQELEQEDEMEQQLSD